MANILVVGNAALDIINHVAEFPPEDAEVRALAQEVRRGGNGANTAVALARLGHACTWAGTLADEPDAGVIGDDLARHGVDLNAVHRVPGGKAPTSYITLSRASGSRTIVHVRDLPEYPAAAFSAIDLGRFDWVHFEGRNLDPVATMLARVRAERPGLRCSLEVEKPRPAIERLFPAADLLLFSRVYARSRGFERPQPFLAAVRAEAPAAELVCGWGAEGAYALGRDDETLFAPAPALARVVDTVGAGDVLNAGIIDGRVRGLPLAQALAGAVETAGRKCARYGIDF